MFFQPNNTSLVIKQSNFLNQFSEPMTFVLSSIFRTNTFASVRVNCKRSLTRRSRLFYAFFTRLEFSFYSLLFKQKIEKSLLNLFQIPRRVSHLTNFVMLRNIAQNRFDRPCKLFKTRKVYFGEKVIGGRHDINYYPYCPILSLKYCKKVIWCTKQAFIFYSPHFL